MRILVTNDDGVDSVGLHILARALRPCGELVVAAPDREFSGAGAGLGALHLIQPEIHRVAIEGVDDAWAVSGPPALCVMFARLGAFGPPFDLVVAGINPGANVGRAVYHSGTVGAALTARAGGISGVAVSQAVAEGGIEGQGWDEMLRDQRWDTAAAVAAAVVGALVEQPPTAPVVLNVNVPNCDLDAVVGWRHASVGAIPPRVVRQVRLEPKLGHEGAFHVRMDWGDAVVLPPETDGGAVECGEVAITYLTGLTATDPIDTLVPAALDRLLAGR
ncbi:MAG: 5'/3'-nucleotidase SurE [Acidimicrobiales bacterium]